jgi:hypothetical protein
VHQTKEGGNKNNQIKISVFLRNAHKRKLIKENPEVAN